MPHEIIAEISGNYHVHKTKGSPVEHDTHGYGHMRTPLSGEHEGIAAAVRKERRLAGIRE